VRQRYPGGPFFAMMVAPYLPIDQLGDKLEEVLAWIETLRE
jgi:hypothetical protein